MSIKRNASGQAKKSPPNNPNRDPNSKRSIKRRARGFVSLEKSSRKHRRAEKRLAISQTIGANGMGAGGVRHKAGEAIDPPTDVKIKTFHQHAGGRLKHYNG